MTERPFRESAKEEDGANESAPNPMASLAAFTLLYESRDGKMCLFEDASGHLTAVRAERLV